jgi:protein TonB
MIAAFIFNASILLALILIPLIYPEALPRQALAFLMEAPLPPTPQSAPQPQPVRAVRAPTEIMPDGTITAPRTIPLSIYKPSDKEPEAIANVPGLDPNSGLPANLADGLGRQPGVPVVRPQFNGPVRVSSSVVAGLLIDKKVPVYPELAKAMHAEGTVILAATISKTGSIENLHVVSGPPVLQQAALDAVKSWRYRPYQLDGQPVEVETTVNVIFSLGR